MRKQRRHTAEFKRQVVERMKTCESIEALARELQLDRKLLYTWKYQVLQREYDRLKKALGQKTLETDFLKDALFRVSQLQQTKEPGVDASTNPSGRGRKGKAN